MHTKSANISHSKNTLKNKKERELSLVPSLKEKEDSDLLCVV